VNLIKNWWLSKINWTGIFLIAMGLLEAAKYTDFVNNNPIMLSIVGTLLLIFRTYSKKQVMNPIQSSLPPARRW